MKPTAFIEAVRAVKQRHGASAAALAALAPLLQDFVHDAVSRRVPWPAESRGAYTRLLLNDPDDDFQVVVVAWPVGKSSPIHNHAGTFGAVAALYGEAEERKFHVLQEEGSRVVLEPAGQTILKAREVTVLAPEEGLELHDMAQRGDGPAATVHVYLTPVESFHVFEPDSDGSHRREPRRLWMDVVRAAELWSREVPRDEEALTPA